MSVEYCHDCDKYIDTDYDAEHFEMHKEETALRWLERLANGDLANSGVIKHLRKLITIEEVEKMREEIGGL